MSEETKEFKDVSELNKFIQQTHKKSIGEHKCLIYIYDGFYIRHTKRKLWGWIYEYCKGIYRGEQ